MKNLFNRFVSEEEGQDLVEYALLLGLIAIICMVGVATLGKQINGYMENVAAQLK